MYQFSLNAVYKLAVLGCVWVQIFPACCLRAEAFEVSCAGEASGTNEMTRYKCCLQVPGPLTGMRCL